MSPNNFTNLGNSIMGSVQRVLTDVENDNIKTDLIKLLRMKYSLEIISENPLVLKKIKY